MKSRHSQLADINHYNWNPDALFHHYYQYFNKYAYSVISAGSDALNELHLSCQCLVLAAICGSVKGKDSLKASPARILRHELNDVISAEFSHRILNISRASPHYSEAQLISFMLHYGRCYTRVYSDPLERLEDIKQAFQLAEKAAVKQDNPLFKMIKILIPNYSTHMTARELAISSKRALVWELIGQNPFHEITDQMTPDRVRPVFYPFRITTKDKITPFLNTIIQNNSEVVKAILGDIETFIDANMTKIKCSASKTNSYNLKISVEELKKNPHSIICFIDETKGVEIARFQLSGSYTLFKAYGDEIHLEIEGIAKDAAYIFENSNGKLILSAEFKTSQAFYLAANVKLLTFNGTIQSEKDITLETRGLIELPEKSAIISGNTVAVRVAGLTLGGKILAAKVCQLEIDDEFSMNEFAQIKSQGGIHLTAGSIKEIRGRIVSDKTINIKSSDTIYLYGAALLYSKLALIVKGRALKSTDKSVLKSDESAYVSVVNKLIIEKDSIWSARNFNVSARLLKNYSPRLLSRNFHFHVKDDLINYSEGVIHAEHTLKFSGGSVWNAGKISYGKHLQVTLNKLFVHGAVDLNSFYKQFSTKKAPNLPSISGTKADITAGAVICIGSSLITTTLSVTSIVEINCLNLMSEVSRHKSGLVSVNLGVNIPNMSEIANKIGLFIADVSLGNFQSALAKLCSWDGILNATACARWILRTLAPAAGKPIDFAWNTLLFISSMPSLFNKCEALYKQDKKIESHQLYSILSVFSNAANQLMITETQVDSLSHGIGSIELQSPIAMLSTISWDITALLIPASTDEALLDASIGSVSVASSLQHRTGVSYQLWSSQVAFNISNTFYVASQNQGMVLANNVSNIGHSLQRSMTEISNNDYNNVGILNDSSTINANRIIWQAKILKDNATIHADIVNMDGSEQLAHDGSATGITSVTLGGGQVTTGSGSHTNAEKVTLAGNSVTHAGAIDSKQLFMIAQQDAELTNSSQVNAELIRVNATNTTLDGHLAVHKNALPPAIPSTDSQTSHTSPSTEEEKGPVADIAVSATNNLSIGENSKISGADATTVMQGASISNAGHAAVDKMIMSATNSVSSTATSSTEAAFYSVSSIDVNQNGAVTIHKSDLPVEQAVTTGEEKAPAADLILHASGKLTSGETSHIKAQGATVLMMGDSVEAKGDTSAQTVAVQATGNVSLADTAKFDVVNFSATANTIEQQSSITAHQVSELSNSNSSSEAPIIAFNAKENLHLGINSHLNNTDGIISAEGKTIFVEGQTAAKRVHMRAEESLILDSSATTSGQQMDLTSAKDTLSHGTIHMLDKDKSAQESTDSGQATNAPEPIKPDLLIGGKNVTLFADSNIDGSNSVVLVSASDKLSDSGQANSLAYIDQSENSLAVGSEAHHNVTERAIYQASTAWIHGVINAKEVDVSVDHFFELRELLSQTGPCSNIRSQNVLAIDTKDSIYLSDNYTFNIDVRLNGASITLANNTIYSSKNITLQSSAGDILTQNNHLFVDGAVTINSQGAYTNNHGSILTSAFYVDAQGSILNSAGALVGSRYVVIKSAYGNLLNDHGLISGNEVSLNATTGNIVNSAGTIQAISYLEELAGQNIENQCVEYDVRGEYDTMKGYEIAYTLGGTGEGHDGIGLVMHANKQLIFDASVTSSTGSNVIIGDEGISSMARHHQYISYYKHRKTWYGRESDTTDYSNQVQSALFFSRQGSNTFISGAGGISACSTQFLSAHENNFYAKKDIQLTGFVLQNKECKNTSNLWGAFGHKTNQTDEVAAPTVVMNPDNINMISEEGSLQLINAAVQTAGELNMHAMHNVIISAPVLNHSYTTESRAVNVSVPLCDFKNMIPLYSDYKALAGSKGGAEMAANSWNAALDSINTANMAFTAVRSNSVGDMFRSLSSLISVDVGYSRTRTTMAYQTVASNVGVQCGSLNIDAGDKVLFLNGVPVNVMGNASIRAKFFGQYGAALQSSIQTDSEGITAGLSLTGNVNTGACLSGSSTTATTYANQVFQVGGGLTVNASQWYMSDANLLAGNLNASVDDMSIVSHANTSSSSSWSASANTNGCLSFQRATNDSAMIGTPSGISVSNSIDLTTKRLSLEGAKILSYGSSHIVADTVESKDVEEYNRGSSFGLNGNAYDFLSNQPNLRPQKAIPTFGVCLGQQDYEATQQSTIWGAGENSFQAGTVTGSLNTSNGSGLNVSRDENYNVEVKVPVFNSAGIQQVRDNFGWAAGKMFSPKVLVPDYETLRFIEKMRAEVDLDLDDLPLREYGAKDLSEVASRQRETRISRWHQTNVKSSETSMEQANNISVLDDVANSRLISDINAAGDWIANTSLIRTINTFNPIVIGGNLLDDARESLSNGGTLNVFADTGLAILSVIPGEAFAVGEFKNASMYLSKKFGFFGSPASEVSERVLYHTITNAHAGQGVLDAIDPIFLNPNSRFGKAFYLSENPDTTLSELMHHNATGVDTIRFNFNSHSARILDLTNPVIAEVWGYEGGEINFLTREIGTRAKDSGFNAIRYPSERGEGYNLAILYDFERLLQPEMIVPIPNELTRHQLVKKG